MHRVRTTALLFTLLVGCGGAGTEVPLELLASRDTAYDGRVVITQGTVRTFEAPRHYWIEDSALNRVAVEPDDRVASYVGQDVRVHGHFTANRQTGRLIVAETVTLLEHDGN